MKKQILPVLLTAMLCISSLPAYAIAKDSALAYGSEGDLQIPAAVDGQLPLPIAMSSKIVAEGDTPHRIHWTLDAKGLLTLKANDRYGLLDKNEKPWDEMKASVNSLVIESGNALNFIPEKMFADNYSLKTVTVNGSLKDIDQGAFQNCLNLTQVTINGNMCEYLGGFVSFGGIGEQAFLGCNNLKSFNVKGVISKIGNGAFSGCNLSKLDATVLGDIGEFAFCGDKALRHIPPIRGSVGNRAFEDTLLSYTGSGVDIVYIVSNHTGTIDGAFTSSDSLKRPSPHLIYTGTQEEFNEKYKNNTGKSIRQYQCIGDNVKWDLEDGVLTISGSGPTIDLVNINEQPWLNIPGRTWDENRDLIKKVVIDPAVVPGKHMLEGLEDLKIPGGSFDGEIPGGPSDGDIPGSTSDSEIPGGTADGAIPGSTSDIETPGADAASEGASDQNIKNEDDAKQQQSDISIDDPPLITYGIELG